MKYEGTIVNVLAIIGLLLVSQFESFSQELKTDFFIPSNREKGTLQGGQRTKLEILERNRQTKAVHLVTIKNLIDHQKEGYFGFSLPGFSDPIISKANHIETKSAENYSWSGILQERLGTITLVSQSGELFGHISVDDKKFELWPLGDDLYALTELDASAFTSEECATIESTDDKEYESKSGYENARFVDCSKHARVLVLFTANAQASVTNINQTAFLAVHQTNDALRNSGILGDAYVQVGMAGPLLLNFNETGVIQTDVQTLSNRSDVQALRNANGADLVILLTGSNYGSVLGIVRDIGPNDPTSYAIVTAGAATGNYSFAHELGHLFGGRHQRCSVWNNGGCDDTAGFAHGYGYSYGFLNLNKCSTIMHQLRPNYARILYYANPNISHDGQLTGTSNSNNARQLWEQSPTIATFRPFIGQLSASVDVKVHYPAFRQYSCEAVSICGVEPHSFEWRVSYDGFNYGSVASTDGGLTISPPTCTNLFIWLRVFSSDSQQVDYFFTLSHFDEGCEESRIRVVTSTQEEEIEVDRGFSVFPNPAKELINMKYYLPESGRTSIVLSNFQGQTLIAQENNLQKYGWHDLTLGTTGLSNGIYFLKMKKGDRVTIRKIVINK